MIHFKSIIAALGLSVTAASAAPINWDINFNNSVGSAVGSFTYDADIDTYSDIDIVLSDISAGTSSLADTLLFQGVNVPGTPLENNEVGFGSAGPDLTGTFRLFFNTVGGTLFSNSGGSIGLSLLSVGRCNNFACTSTILFTGVVSDPSGVTTVQGTPAVEAVPLPATGMLLAGALGLMGWRAKRRSA